MIFRRSNKEYILKLLKGAIEDLRLAIMKVRVAEGIVNEVRRNKVDKLLLQTAFAGFPIPSNFFANMYASSSLESIGKAVKKLRKFKSIVNEKYPHLYVTIIKDVVDPCIDRLNELLSSEEKRSGDEVIKVVNEVSAQLISIVNYVEEVIHEY